MMLLLMALFAKSIAQEKKSYINFSTGGGIQTLSFDLLNGVRKEGFGGLLSLGYGYKLTPVIGIQTGLEFASIQSFITLNKMTSESLIDSDGDSFEQRTYFNNWKEKQTMYAVNIPLNFLLSLKVGDKSCLQPYFGGAFLIPIQSQFEIQTGDFELRGYYPQWNVEIANAPRHDWTIVSERYSGDIKLKPCFMVTAGIGWIYSLIRNLDFLTGAYLYYGLNDMNKKESGRLYQSGVYNGIMNTNEVGIVKPFSVGIKIGINVKI